eukprot:CAMPEP_0202964486 /NCGR_PEP_ID=MMETSP1396-20130829/8576_1 /ASSEMBLY_ACC=CAM_ASM_000872 /TAXON_ID= /ORGANISM="Pseudokeronopsis sp., Strain Brazil" /LENGTH=177 /DNA_ID=CAMNT_0049686633 /DNA_START=137 /DNA_END=670 /DNA_ORIENTATION=+
MSFLHLVQSDFLLNVELQAIGAIRFYIQPNVEALDVVEVVALGELLEFFVEVEVVEADAASSEAHGLVEGLEGDCLYLLELTRSQTSLHKVQPIFVEGFDCFLTALVLLFDILPSVFIQVVVHVVDVHPPQQPQHSPPHLPGVDLSADPNDDQDAVTNNQNIAQDYPKYHKGVLLQI